jgi:hypothetical protein
MASAPTKPRRWIDAEIDRLDPAEDWAQMYRLMNAYRPNDFMLDLIYAHVFPHFMVPTHGAIPVWRNGEDAKVVNRASLRADTTSLHNMIWWHYGPDHPETKKSVDTINAIHAHYEERYPSTFQHHSDYVYVWCFSAVTMHRLRVKMGLPGLSDNEKIVVHRFWKELAPLFVVPNDSSSHHPVDDYPDDFDGIIAWLDDFEGGDWPVNETGAKTSKAVVDQFLFRYIPRPLHFLMRAALNSFYADSVLKAYQISPPPRPVKAVIRRVCGFAMALSDRLVPDPSESYLDRRNSLTDEQRKTRVRQLRESDNAFARVFRTSMKRRNAARPVPISGCPHMVTSGHDG